MQLYFGNLIGEYYEKNIGCKHFNFYDDFSD
jgi:hypothetical protein